MMGRGFVRGAIEPVVQHGLDNLARRQLPSGEFSSYATPLGGEYDWTYDSSVFVTALCVLALQRVSSSTAVPMIDAAKHFLQSEVAHGPLWRFWTHDHDRHLEIPCDADDSACVTMALNPSSHEADLTRRLLTANRDHLGRFHTWFVPQGIRALRPRFWRIALDEMKARSARATFWDATEATPGDVDVVVNANVLRCFGPASPAAAVAYVSDIVRRGEERASDSWHRNEFSCWYSVADGIRRGVPYPDDIPGIIRDRIAERANDGGNVLRQTPLDAAHALSTLCAIGDPGRDGEALARSLLEIQSGDGGWSRSIFFYGGPREVFAWGSEDFSTAASLAALADYAASS